MLKGGRDGGGGGGGGGWVWWKAYEEKKLFLLFLTGLFEEPCTELALIMGHSNGEDETVKG